MSRLRAYPRQRQAPATIDRLGVAKHPDYIPPVVSFDLGKLMKPPPDERPKTITTERLWRAHGALAYPVGAEVPDEERPHLFTFQELQRLRGEIL